ncbi:LysM peptidoglycan-binding domain-containing protein [Paenibacillus abyssi]|uniref:LysM domain-containing protein n=1 Tax=Paenibacillus abyssi TaxID=1340531 RepID=A0A917G381_9BACL|nr:LysM peptidoglycan-binding domain-containing protein [Paenibacillus abyssi]GGG20196.1 hypothetical protein GCM10010916_41190 [Paenibacillus abyssi]
MKIHIVKKGESLYSISQKYGVALEEVVKLNPGIANPDEIDVGMKIKLPSSPVQPGDMEIMHQHAVQQGDSLWKLSKAWGIPLSDMIKANPQLKNPNVLLLGEVVNIPKATGDAGGAAIPQTEHESMHYQMMSHPEKVPTHPIAPSKPNEPEKVPTDVVSPVAQPPEAKPVPEPAPLPAPIAEEKHAKPAFPIHFEYQHQHIDLFQHFGKPATEVMSSYELPKAPEYPSHIHHMPYGIGPSVMGAQENWPSHPLANMNMPAGVDNMYLAPTMNMPAGGDNMYHAPTMNMPAGGDNMYPASTMNIHAGAENQYPIMPGHAGMMTGPQAGAYGYGPIVFPPYAPIPHDCNPGFNAPVAGFGGWGPNPQLMGYPAMPMPYAHGYGGGNYPWDMTQPAEAKPCGCDCHEKREPEQPAVDTSGEAVVKQEAVKKSAVRKKEKKASIRTKSAARQQPVSRKTGSIPWINN